MPSIKMFPAEDGSRVAYTQVQDAFGPGAPGSLQMPKRTSYVSSSSLKRSPTANHSVVKSNSRSPARNEPSSGYQP